MQDNDQRLAMTGIQQELHKAIADENPACAEYYRAALATLNDADLPDRTAITAHSLRELMEKLPNEGATDNAPDLNARVNKLHETWTPADQEDQDQGGERWDGRIRTALRLFLVAAGEFFKERVRIGGNRSELANQFFNRLEASSELLPPDMQRKNTQEWNRLRKYFNDVSHHRFTEDDTKFRATVTQFEVFLYARLRPRPTTDFAVIDALLEKPERIPMPDTITEVLATIETNTANYRYFFENLTSPTWLQPLAERSIFKTPKPTEEVGDGVRFPTWPASQYLARMARLPEAQPAVAKIVRDMDDTDNISVHRDLLDVALALPPAHAATFAKKAGLWAQAPFHGIVPYQIGELIAHLANGGQTKAAFLLASATFSLSPQPTKEPENDEWSPAPEPRAWLDDWHYHRALTQATPALERLDSTKTISFLCALLDKALQYSRGSNEIEYKDYSSSWCAAIEDDHDPAQLRNTLVRALRNTTRDVIEKDQTKLLPVLEELAKHPWPVFERLRLYLLTEFPDAGKETIAAIAPSLAPLESSTRHEAARLLKRAFGTLAPDAQETILRTIDAGPDENDVVDWLKFIGNEPTPVRIAEYGTAWRAERFALLRDHVPPTWKERVDEILSSTGTVRNLQEPNRSTTWVGPTSPQSTEELRTLGPTGVIAYLKEWTPARGPYDATPEGLGRVLADLIAEDATNYAERASEFTGLDPTYVRTLFSGLLDACRKKTAFAWSRVLALAEWVVGQPREIPERKKALMEADPDWGWTRGVIADLVGQGMQDGPTHVPSGEREVVWRVLSELIADPDPTPDHEARYGGDNLDPSTMSLNTVRGKAFHALVQYGLWIRRFLDQQEGPIESASMDQMPEVREALDEHLDEARDPALTIRAVYGQHFPWLQLLDREWAQQATTKLFPDDPQQEAYWRAAWESYLMHCLPYDKVFPLLRQQYQRAVRELPSHQESAKRPGDPANRLGEHLMMLYMRGILTRGEEDELLSDFFRVANDAVRGHALSQAGQWLKNPASSAISAEVLNRLRLLWEWRLEVATGAESKDQFVKELSSFGWWFSSGKFDDKWSLEQLHAALRITGGSVPDFDVAERLASLAQQMPLRCAQIVAQIAEGDQQGWTLQGNREHFLTALRTVLASDNLEAKKRTRDLVEYLIARGFFEYRSLVAPAG